MVARRVVLEDTLLRVGPEACYLTGPATCPAEGLPYLSERQAFRLVIKITRRGYWRCQCAIPWVDLALP